MKAHIPVLVGAVREAALWVSGEHEVGQRLWGIDGTLGAGGHASVVLESDERMSLLGCDHDQAMLKIAAGELAHFGERVQKCRARISELDAILEAQDTPFDGSPVWMLFDLGVASVHLDEAVRGFSFQRDAELDMRMDLRRARTAADIVNTWSEERLADLFYVEGGERRSRAVASAIVAARRRAPIRRTLMLADLVERAVGRSGKTHGATRVFQALRREVNCEGAELDAALALGAKWLAVGGVLCVISFHSGESRAVKRWMAKEASEGRFELLWKKPRRATELECRENPRARSAEVRTARKLAYHS